MVFEVKEEMGRSGRFYSSSSMRNLILKKELPCNHGTIIVSVSPIHTLPSDEHGGDDQSVNVGLY